MVAVLQCSVLFEGKLKQKSYNNNNNNNNNNNIPDILLYDKENKEVDLIDIAVPLSHNIQNVYAQKINKYAELATEIQQMWNVQKINIRPMVISATGIVPQHLKTQLSELEITQLLPAIQRSVLLDMCHTVRQFLRN
jgi:hypothetical protein